MKIYDEIDLKNFEFWGNAVDDLKEAFKSCEIIEMQEFEKLDSASD